MLCEDYKNVIAQLLSGNVQFVPNYVYLEFQNTTSPVTLPVTSQVGRSYYDSLDSSTDYLRVPITIKPVVNSATNKVTYTVLVTSTESINGLPFSSTVHSRIFGVALVCAPIPTDHTQDIVFAREYFSGNKQLTVVDNQTFCFSFELTMTS